MDESHFLPDIKFCRAVRVGLAAIQNCAAVERVNSSKTFDQRGFSSPVFAEQSQYFTGMDVEADILQRAGAAKALHNVFKADERCGLVWTHADDLEKVTLSIS